MKPYGSKKTKKPRGDGCFLCTQERKSTKTVARTKAAREIETQLEAYKLGHNVGVKAGFDLACALLGKDKK